MNFLPQLIDGYKGASDFGDTAEKHRVPEHKRSRQFKSDKHKPMSEHQFTNPTTRIIVADDHPLFRDAISQILPGIVEDCEITCAESFQQLYQILNHDSGYDLILMDLHMPGNKGFTGLATIRAEFPAIAIVMVSASESPQIIQRAVSLDISGYIPKSAGFEQIKEAINCVFEGGLWLPEFIKSDVEMLDNDTKDYAAKISSLTPQQLKVLSLISDGMLNKQIAFELNIQETTIKHHVSAILRKLDVNNRTLAGIMYKELQVEDDAQELKKA